MRRTQVSYLCVAVFFLVMQHLFAQFPTGYTFTSSYNGQTVLLTDSTVSNETCDCYGFEIWAVNFTLDGANYKLRGTTGGDHDYIGLGIRPDATVSNDTVKNLEVTRWGHGVYGRNWAYGGLDSCWIHHNWRNGYQSGPTAGNNTEIEVSNSTFDWNEWTGFKISDASYYYVHDNTIINNGHHPNVPDTEISTGGIELLRDGSHHNRIENNTIEGNADFGLMLHTWYNNEGASTGMPKHNLIINNVFENNKVLVQESDSNTFIGNEFTGSASRIEVKDCIGNVFIDCIFGGFWGALYLTVQDAVVTFIGTSFEGATVNLSGASSELTVAWHVEATITEADVPVGGALVQFFDKDLNLVTADTTDAEGRIDSLDLVAYVQTVDGKAYLTPYTVVATKDAEEIFSTELDLTDNTHITTPVSGSEDTHSDLLPKEYHLGQNHPNPFNPETMISFELPKSGHVSLTIHDIRGQLIRTLVDGYRVPGSYTLVWDARNELGDLAASGVYFYTLRTGDFRESKRMILLR